MTQRKGPRPATKDVMNRHALFALLLLCGCFQPVDVGFDDAGTQPGDSGVPVCTVGMNQTCNELSTLSTFAGTCTATGCVCNAGYEKAPSGRCRWVNDADAGGCVGNGPLCVMGTPGGLCGDAALQSTCTAGQWTCPQGTIPSTQCACVGRPPANCTCTATGWSCPDAGASCTPGVAMSCNDGPIGGVGAIAGTCSAAGTCTCHALFELNPLTGRCRVASADAGSFTCTGTGNDQSCNELLAMASFAGQCVAGRCMCNTGFEPSPSGRCQPVGAVCSDRSPQSCSQDTPSPTGSCVVGQCLCGPSQELDPRTGRCSDIMPFISCTVGQDQTCNGSASMSTLAGTCVQGQCSCNPGFVFNSAGRCVPSAVGVCTVSNGTSCTLERLDGGLAPMGNCGATPVSAGCSCGGPTAMCLGLCPPTPGRTCSFTNCGSISCVPPMRCVAWNRCDP